MFRNAFAEEKAKMVQSKMMAIIHDPCTTGFQRRYMLHQFWMIANKVDRKRKQTYKQIDPNAAYRTAAGAGARAVCVGCKKAWLVDTPFWNPNAIERLESRMGVPVSKKRSAPLCSECTPSHNEKARCSRECGVWLVPGITCTKNQMRGHKNCLWCLGQRNDAKLSDEDIQALRPM